MRDGTRSKTCPRRIRVIPRSRVTPPSILQPAPAFSIIELLVVLILFFVIFVLYSGSLSLRKQRGMKVVCAENLQKIYVALSLYQNEHAGSFPVDTNARTSAAALAALVPKYTSETSTFICPGIWEPKELPTDRFAQQTISYSYYMGRSLQTTNAPLMTDRQVDTSSKAAGQRVFSVTGQPPGNNHQQFGGNILFCDGQTQSIGTNAPIPMLIEEGVVLLNPQKEP